VKIAIRNCLDTMLEKRDEVLKKLRGGIFDKKALTLIKISLFVSKKFQNIP
jgi:hypothetical protein